MGITRQQRRYTERQQLKAVRRKGRNAEPVGREPKQFWTKTKALFAIVGPTAAVISLLYAFKPSMDVIAPPWESNTDASNAHFQFKNTGRIGIRNVRFDCVINTPTNQNLQTSGSSSSRPLTGVKSQIIGEIAPDQSVSRDCFGGIPAKIGGHPFNIKINASYVWPVINYRSDISRYFVSETDGTRVWMTPENEPVSQSLATNGKAT
jgi:hypothetical protein